MDRRITKKLDPRPYKQKPYAIILGCHKSGLGVIRALGEKSVPLLGLYYHKKDMGHLSKYVHQSFLCPNPDLYENAFIKSILRFGENLDGSVLIPSEDATLLAVSKHKSELEKYFKTTFVGWDILKTIIKKKYTYRIAEEAGVPCPKTIIPHTISEAKEFAKEIGFPCLLKPSISHRFFNVFRKKMIIINDNNELEKGFLISQELKIEMMLQELIPGDDTHGYNYNSFFINGHPIVEFTAQKCRLSPPGTGFPRVIVSKYIPELFEYGRKMVSATNYEGYSCIEFKQDARTGVFKLMEINGRQNLSTSLAVKCGINFPYLTYMHAFSGQFPEIKHNYRTGVYWIDLEKDILETVKGFRSKGFTISNYILPYLRPKVFCILSAKDPKPMLKRVTDALKALFSKMCFAYKKQQIIGAK